MSERITCTYCGRKGHRTSHCHWAADLGERRRLTERDLDRLIAWKSSPAPETSDDFGFYRAVGWSLVLDLLIVAAAVWLW
jgi:hypothetical protein